MWTFLLCHMYFCGGSKKHWMEFEQLKTMHMYMLWFKFILGLKFFELASILFAIVPDCGNEYTTKENKN